jgi:adenylylsulfate kinase-like enzyme
LNTSNCLSELIENARIINEKAICFLTGVPGSGKTLIGLNVATNQLENQHSKSSVFLSGNGPLVAI